MHLRMPSIDQGVQAEVPVEPAPRRCGQTAKKFTESVTLSSTEPVGFPLPRTTSGLGFELLALRARCKRDSRPAAGRLQEPRAREWRTLRKLPLRHGEMADRARCSAKAGDARGRPGT